MWNHAITKKLNPVKHTYVMNNLSSTSSKKDFGVMVGDNLKWNCQTAVVINKANRMIGLLRRNIDSSFGVDTRRMLFSTWLSKWSLESQISWSSSGTWEYPKKSYLFCAWWKSLYNNTVSYKERLLRLKRLPVFLVGKYDLDLFNVLTKSTCIRTRTSDSLTFRIPIFKTTIFQFSYFIRSADSLWNSLPFYLRSEQNPNIFKALWRKDIHAMALYNTFDVDISRTWFCHCFKCGIMTYVSIMSLCC